MAFKYFSSSKRKSAADCSVRCIMAAEGLTWYKAFDLLCEEARKQMDVPNEIRVIGKTLEKNWGYKAQKAPMVATTFGKKRRLTVGQFAKANPKGTYILSLSGHIVCLKDGNWLDTWDCGDYKVFKLWKKP